MPASAGIKYWDPVTHGGGTSDWRNPNNWNEAGVGAGVPGAADHVIIHSIGPMPIVSAPAPTVNYLTPGWHAVDTHTGINPGGSLHANQAIILGGPGGTSQVSIKEGTLSTSSAYYSAWNPLQADAHAGKAFTHVNAGGVLDVANVGFWGGIWDPELGEYTDPYHTGENANIDIEPGGQLKIGRALGAGELDWWNSIGLLTGADGTGMLQESWDGSKTTITALDAVKAGDGSPLYWENKWSAHFEDGEVNPGFLSSTFALMRLV